MFTGPNIISNDLILYLDATNPKSYPGSGTTWYDLSKIGGSAIAFNSPTFTTPNSFNFDGSNDFFRMQRDDLNGGSFDYENITIHLWIKPSTNLTSSGTGNNLLTIENTVEISIGNRGNGFCSIYYASTPWAWRGSNSDLLKIGKWNLLTYVHADVGRWVYVNGIERFYINNSGALTSGRSTYPYLTLMGRYTGTSSQAEGDLAIVKIYNRVSTAEEVLQNYNATKSRFKL